MTTYYYKHGILYQTKTMCNLVETWQHECRVYPDEIKPYRQHIPDTWSWNQFSVYTTRLTP